MSSASRDHEQPETSASSDGGGSNGRNTRVGGADSEKPDTNHELELRFGVNYVDLREIPVDPACLTLLPGSLMEERRCVAFGFDGRRILVAMVNPNDLRIHDEIKRLVAGRRFRTLVCREEEFSEFMQRANGLPKGSHRFHRIR